MNSTPFTPASIMRLTALLPPPPTPTILTSVKPFASAAIWVGASTIWGTTPSGRTVSSIRPGSKPPLIFTTPQHLLGERAVDLRRPFGASIAEDRSSGRTGLQDLAIGPDFGLEHERPPPFAQ